MLRSIRVWIIKKLAAGDAVILNMHVLNGFYLYLPKSKNLIRHNVVVAYTARPDTVPDTTHFSGVK